MTARKCCRILLSRSGLHETRMYDNRVMIEDSTSSTSCPTVTVISQNAWKCHLIDISCKEGSHKQNVTICHTFLLRNLANSNLFPS